MHLIKSITPGLGAGGRTLTAGSPGGTVGRDPRRLLMSPAFPFACSRFPLRCCEAGGGVTAGIRGWGGCRRVDGSMDSRQAAVLLVLLLLIDPSYAEGPGGRQEDQLSQPLAQEEDSGPHLPQDAQSPESLLRSLLQAMERPGRSQAFLFQPQRFGRNTRGSWSNERLSPRAGEGLHSQFWSLAVPQRFGKK
ncbi:pro-FMRFamide-related neuropeptide FF isoform X1 [Cebus imitator]|uniref:pro-FMRFamide-related neuropeptide FF isoform X1 n=1 Tax=Cebus imitator TaxID=2715852 RepID=UPI00189B805F|nr:pro-FMRFamide-related neuropeptide FF isoform X1 [Cebus imitator]